MRRVRRGTREGVRAVGESRMPVGLVPSRGVSMQTQQRGGSEPPPPDVPPELGIGATPFGVFRRLRSQAGKDVYVQGLPRPGARPIEVVPLREAFSRRWDDDRHIVLYTADRPYRINNAALGKVRVEVRLLAFDVDNHGRDAPPNWMAGERVKIAALLAAHPGGFVHTTKRGWRAFFALAPFPMRSEDDKESFALFYARVAAYLFAEFGIVIDDALTRWNQPIRLPYVVRDGHVLDAEIIAGDIEALRVFALPDDIPAVPDLRSLAAVHSGWGGVAKRWQPMRKVLRIASAAFDHVPLPPDADCVAAAERWAREEAPRAIQGMGGRATARSVAATLYVGFALKREDVARILLGPYNRRRCSPPWSEEESDDLRGIAQAVARTPIQVWGFMVSRDRTGIEVARANLAAAAETRRVVPLDEVSSRLVALMEEHRALVVRATYGAGKTYATAEYVATRTRGRVIVIVPTHELARTWIGALAEAGESDVAYHASVVQRVDKDGKPHCDNPRALKLYREGGDVAHDICPVCPRAETCPAYTAPPVRDARVHVLPREMISRVGVTDEDLVVFDDSAVDLLEWHKLGTRELRRLSGADARLLPGLQTRYLGVFVAALLAGPRKAEESARAGLVAASLEVPSSGDILRFVAGRLLEGLRTPRVPRDALDEGEDEQAETFRDVGRFRRVLRFAAAYAAGDAKIRWSGDSRTVHGESAAATLLRTHAGRLVVLDATANVEELRALRSNLHVERLDVDDAGDARRVLLFAQHANRTALREVGARRELLDAWLAAVLKELRERGAKRPVFVTYKSLVPELRAHPALVAWSEEEPGRTLTFAHYGALRGSNRFRKRDAIVTLGDPWLHGDDVTGRADWLALDEPSYRIALATAELGQAHGRSRSVRRRGPLTHIHVGRLVPDGWGAGVEVGPLGGPPERTRGAADHIEFVALVGALGGNRSAAVHLGCSSSAVANWRSGIRGLPRDVLERARALATAHSKPSASSGEAGRGAPSVEMDTVTCIKEPKDCVHLGEVFSTSPADETVLPLSVAEVAGLSGREGVSALGAKWTLAEEEAERLHLREMNKSSLQQNASSVCFGESPRGIPSLVSQVPSVLRREGARRPVLEVLEGGRLGREALLDEVPLPVPFGVSSGVWRDEGRAGASEGGLVVARAERAAFHAAAAALVAAVEDIEQRDRVEAEAKAYRRRGRGS